MRVRITRRRHKRVWLTRLIWRVRTERHGKRWHTCTWRLVGRNGVELAFKLEEARTPTPLTGAGGWEGSGDRFKILCRLINSRTAGLRRPKGFWKTDVPRVTQKVYLFRSIDRTDLPITLREQPSRPHDYGETYSPPAGTFRSPRSVVRTPVKTVLAVKKKIKIRSPVGWRNAWHKINTQNVHTTHCIDGRRRVTRYGRHSNLNWPVQRGTPAASSLHRSRSVLGASATCRPDPATALPPSRRIYVYATQLHRFATPL